MTKKRPSLLVYRFSYSQFQTDGKLHYLLEVLRNSKAKRVFISLLDNSYDSCQAGDITVQDKLDRAKKVIARLRRGGASVDLVLPGGIVNAAKNPRWLRELMGICRCGANCRAGTLWIDDTGSINGLSKHPKGKIADRTKIIACAKLLGRVIHKESPRLRIGLLAATTSHYNAAGLYPEEIAMALAGHCKPLIAQSQGFTRDTDRTEVLEAATTVDQLKTRLTTLPGKAVEMWGMLDYELTDGFGKSAEASQMQIALNLLGGVDGIILDCFDRTGTPPRDENIYTQMAESYEKFINKLKGIIPAKPVATGICVVIPDSQAKKQTLFDNSQPWAKILRRMGIATCFSPASAVGKGQYHTKNQNLVYVLAGDVVRAMSAKQLKLVFNQGVLLDVTAAKTLEEMKLTKLTGVHVGGVIHDLQTEIITDGSFAASYYGHRTVLAGYFGNGHCRRIKAANRDVKHITTLHRKNNLPNIPGLAIFDDNAHNSRSAVLPYSLSQGDDISPLLSVERQQLFYDIFCWLLRHKLTCFVENSPDLVPFYLADPDKRRVILALLNLSFDWAIDSRIRLNNLPFKIKRIRELNEHGKIEPADLELVNIQSHKYIQLTAETAVPPMQITVLLLEG